MRTAGISLRQEAIDCYDFVEYIVELLLVREKVEAVP